MVKKEKRYLTIFVTSLFATSIALSACTPGQDGPSEPSDEYAILLNYNDGSSRPFTKFVDKGKSINLSDIDSPTRQGYSFAKWTTDEAGTSDVTFPYTPTNDVTFYAQWTTSIINVTFDFNLGEGSTVTTTSYVMQVNYNSSITNEDVNAVNAMVPEWQGHVFADYWETANGTRVSFESPYVVKKDITFYAHWRDADTKIYNVTFDENYEGGKTHLYENIEEGSSIALKDAPANPSRTGYDLKGWATTSTATESDVTFPYTPSGTNTNITLYGVWAIKTFTITFRYNYKKSPAANGVYKQEKYVALSQVTEPDTISRDGFEFLGWFTHAYEGTKVSFPFEATATTNLYAHWRANRMTPVNNIFDAEFTPIRSDEQFPGYSGSTLGTGIIQLDGSNDFGAYSDNYPLLDDAHDQPYGNFVTYLYKMGATLTFNIYSDRNVSGVKLYAKLATEIIAGGFVITPDGDFGYQFIVNGESINYGAVDLTGLTPAEAGQEATRFQEFYICDVSLNEGLNVIQLVTNNTFELGTMSAIAPEVDYIRLETSSATLSWHPEYDNLYRN